MTECLNALLTFPCSVGRYPRPCSGPCLPSLAELHTRSGPWPRSAPGGSGCPETRPERKRRVQKQPGSVTCQTTLVHCTVCATQQREAVTGRCLCSDSRLYLICPHKASLHGVGVDDAELLPHHHPAASLLALADLPVRHTSHIKDDADR